MNAMQTTTGTVHIARTVRHQYTGTQQLAGICQGIGSATRAYLAQTDKPVTCSRCIAKAAKAGRS